MITINNKSIVGRVIQRKYCSTVVITNYELLPVDFLEILSKLSFVINTTTWYPDLVCVISNDNLDELIYKLVRISSFCKIEQVV